MHGTARDDNKYNQIKEEVMIKVESVYFEILGCTGESLLKCHLYFGKVKINRNVFSDKVTGLS